MESAGNLGRVLIIVQNLPVPFDRRVWLEATTLTRSGYDVSVICPKGKGFDRSFEQLEGIDIYRYSLPIEAAGVLGFIVEFLWCFICTSMKSIKVMMLGRGFDVIHACNPPETYWVLGRFWKFFGKKFLFDHHDLSPEMYEAKFGTNKGLIYWVLLQFERLTFQTAEVVITTNESHKEIAKSRGGKQDEDVYVVRSGPDLNRFKTYPVDHLWKKGKPYLLVYLGEICKQDGVDHLVRAVKILRDQMGRRDFHCVFVGGGPYQGTIKDYADEQEVDDVCTFTGRVSDEDLCRILSSADIGVDPDPKNNWSDKSTMNKIMEYMFFGLPIVSYDLKENKFSAGKAALYAESNSEEALARNISHLLDSPDTRSEMSKIGYKKLREELSWKHSIESLLSAYSHVFGCPKSHGAGTQNVLNECDDSKKYPTHA